MTLSDYQKNTDFPNKPGVYFFKRGNMILYIGKATNLSQRTKSYFQTKLMETRGPIIVKMVEEATHIEYTETDSVLEALLLESYLIKEHQPEYNTKEKDDKSYNYVVITEEDFPRIFVVRERALNTIKTKQETKIQNVFGPFPSRKQLLIALSIIRKIFPFFDKKSLQKHTKDFYEQLGLVPGTNDQESQNYYQKNIAYITLFFQGKKRSIIKHLEKDMAMAADALLFEKAQRIKEQIYALEHIRDLALLRHDFELSPYINSFRMEAYDIAHTDGHNMVGVMVVHNGREIDSSEHRMFTIRSTEIANDTGALYETISRRLKHTEWAYPHMVVVDGGLPQKRVAEKALREHDLSIPVVAVVKNKQHKAEKILGQKKLIERHVRTIVALNAESHRFAIDQHKRKRGKSFLHD